MKRQSSLRKCDDNEQSALSMSEDVEMSHFETFTSSFWQCPCREALRSHFLFTKNPGTMRFYASAVATLALISCSHAFIPAALRPVTFKTSSMTELSATGSTITMPALSSTMKEGRVVSWLKSEGDEIEAGEAIMVVESDKADMDVEAFEDGFLAKIIVAEGDMAPVGEAVALIASSAGEIDDVVASFSGGGAAAAPAAAATEEAAPAASAGR